MDIEVLAITAWSLLMNRNAVHHGDPGKQAATIVTESSRDMEEYCLAQAPSSPWPVHHPTSWSLPLPNIFKVNTGGAVLGQLDKGRCGIGVVIHNDKGQIMGALSKRIPYPLGAMEIEAKALDCLAIFPWVLGLHEIILESDTQVVIHAIAGTHPASVRPVITGTKTCLSKFRSWKESITSRNCNSAAHLLARFADVISDCTNWVEDTPPIISSQVEFDVLNLGSARLMKSANFLIKRKIVSYIY